MPYIDIQIFEGRDEEKKQRLVSAITKDVSEILEIDPEGITIAITEYKQENWASGGVLFSKKNYQVK